MRIKYSILWIENEVDWLEPSIEYVRDIVESYGFSLDFKHVKSEAEIEGLLEEEEPLKHYDLILVDFQLDRGDRGSRIIEKIRDHKIYTDVIFYSQDVQGIRQAVKDHFLDGVFCASRNNADFEEKFEKVFYSTIKKIEDISAIRGLMLSEASELDHRVQILIGSFFNKFSDGDQGKVRNYIMKDIVGDLNKKTEVLRKQLEESSNIDIINHRFFDAYKKMRILGKILDTIDDKSLISKDAFTKGYNEEIISIRNELAHCIEEYQDNKKVLVTSDTHKTFDSDACKNIRKNLLKHSGYLDSIQRVIELK